MMVIVLLITLTLGLLYLSLQNYASVPNAYTIKYQSHHYRFKPVKHKFVGTNFNYVLHKLGDESNGSRLFKNCSDSWSILRVNPTMYLTCGYNKYDLLTNVRKTLEDRGISSLKASSVWMMTLPIILGLVHINNVTLYYCYDQDKRHSLTIFELHNSSFERHMHVHVVGDSSSRSPKQNSEFSHVCFKPRSFHISPVDSRKGFRSFSYSIPFEVDDGSQIVKAPRLKATLFDEHHQSLLTANLIPKSPVSVINIKNVFNLLITQALSNVLLIRHSVIQGYKLAIISGSKLYSTPPLGHTKNHKINPTQADDNNHGFLGFNEEPFISKYSRKLLLNALENAIRSEHRDTKITISYTDKHIPEIVIGERKSNINLHLLVRSWDFYNQLLVSPNVDYVVNVLSDRGEDLFRASDITIFKNVLNSSKVNTQTISCGLFQYVRYEFVTWLRHQSPNVNIDFSLSTTKNYVSDSWVAVFIAVYMLLTWRLHSFIYNLMGIRFIDSQAPWKALERIQ